MQHPVNIMMLRHEIGMLLHNAKCAATVDEAEVARLRALYDLTDNLSLRNS